MNRHNENSDFASKSKQQFTIPQIKVGHIGSVQCSKLIKCRIKGNIRILIISRVKMEKE